MFYKTVLLYVYPYVIIIVICACHATWGPNLEIHYSILYTYIHRILWFIFNIFNIIGLMKIYSTILWQNMSFWNILDFWNKFDSKKLWSGVQGSEVRKNLVKSTGLRCILRYFHPQGIPYCFLRKLIVTPIVFLLS